MSSQELSDRRHVTATLFPYGGVARVCKLDVTSPGHSIQEWLDCTVLRHVVGIVDGRYGNIDVLRTADYRPIGGDGGTSS